MALKISDSSFFEKRYLVVDSSGVTFFETAAFGGKRVFPFSQVDCVLMSEDHMLSFQVGKEVFSVHTDPTKSKHLQVIKTLVAEVARAARGVG